VKTDFEQKSYTYSELQLKMLTVKSKNGVLTLFIISDPVVTDIMLYHCFRPGGHGHCAGVVQGAGQ